MQFPWQQAVHSQATSELGSLEEADAQSSRRASSRLPMRGMTEQVAQNICLVLPTLMPTPEGE